MMVEEQLEESDRIKNQILEMENDILELLI